MKDPIKKYFQEKIQITFATSNLAQKMKEGGTLKSGNKSRGSRNQNSAKNNSDMPIRKGGKGGLNLNLTIKKQRELRNKKFNFQNRVVDNRVLKRNNTVEKQVMQNAEQISKGNDSIVEKSLQDQNKQLQDKLRIRRERSIHRSMSRIKNGDSDSPPTKRSIYQKGGFNLNTSKILAMIDDYTDDGGTPFTEEKKTEVKEAKKVSSFELEEPEEGQSRRQMRTPQKLDTSVLKGLDMTDDKNNANPALQDKNKTPQLGKQAVQPEVLQKTKNDGEGDPKKQEEN